MLNSTLSPDEAVEIWTKALESGEYEQGLGYLHIPPKKVGDKDKYCCLGVITNEYQKRFNDLGTEIRDGYVCYNEAYCVLPSKVMDWIGITSSCGQYTFSSLDEFVERNLYRDNDAKRLSFKEIAQIIRENKEVLFKTQTAST